MYHGGNTMIDFLVRLADACRFVARADRWSVHFMESNYGSGSLSLSGGPGARWVTFDGGGAYIVTCPAGDWKLLGGVAR